MKYLLHNNVLNSCFYIVAEVKIEFRMFGILEIVYWNHSA